MATRDFFISGDGAEGSRMVEQAATDLGYRLTALDNGGVLLERGKKGLTIGVGAFAGKNFYVSFFGQYFTGSNGELVARLTSNTAGGILGGAIGVAKAASAFEELAGAVQQHLYLNGRLVNVVTG